MFTQIGVKMRCGWVGLAVRQKKVRKEHFEVPACGSKSPSSFLGILFHRPQKQIFHKTKELGEFWVSVQDNPLIQ